MNNKQLLEYYQLSSIVFHIETIIVLTVLLLLFLQNCCMVHFVLLKPLKSNFLQFLEEASTGPYVGAIP